MKKSLAIVGAPSSAGAYAPGQEKAPNALRDAGLLDRLRANGLDVIDLGNTGSFRWRADRSSPRAMHVSVVVAIASEVALLVSEAQAEGRIPIVLGGDCTVELGTIAGLMGMSGSIGLVYVDLDADLQTPDTTTDGALDWMGVAHLVGATGARQELVSLFPRIPALQGDEVLLFGTRNIEAPERERIEQYGITVIHGDEVTRDPLEAASRATKWSRRFDRVALHFDVDVIDFEDFPIAEHVRRKEGIAFDIVLAAVDSLFAIPNLAAVTITEINPDHDPDGTTISTFATRLAKSFAHAAAHGAVGDTD